MLLRKDDPWPESLPIPDIRDWRVVDADGATIGFVQTVVVNREDGAIEFVMTGANERFLPSEVEIADGMVRVNQSLRRAETSRSSEESGRKPSRSFQDAYRDHFRKTYSADAHSFESMHPAYRFGRTISLDADSAGRSFARAEEDVRGQYVARGLAPPYGAVREAVRFAFELAQGRHGGPVGGMEREAEQIMGEDDRATEDATRAGRSMGTSEPASEDKSVLD